MKNSTKCLFLLGMFAVLSTGLFAQPVMSERPSTEQPGFYVGAYTLYPGNFVMENAVVVEGVRNSNLDILNLSIPSTLFRYGLTDWLEVRVREELRHTSVSVQGQRLGDTYLNALSVGAKARIVQPGGKWPQIALVTFLQIPRTGSMGVGPNVLAPSILLATDFALCNNYAGYVNLGTSWDGISIGPTYQYAAAVERGLATGLTAFAEAYGFLDGPSTVLDHRYDLGLIWGWSPHLQADLSGGIGFRQTVQTWFISGGFTFRAIPRRNRQ